MTSNKQKEEKTMEVDQIKDCIASWRKERDQLEAQNQGVRASYISTDLAILEERIQRHVALVKEMEGEAK